MGGLLSKDMLRTSLKPGGGWRRREGESLTCEPGGGVEEAVTCEPLGLGEEERKLLHVSLQGWGRMLSHVSLLGWGGGEG